MFTLLIYSIMCYAFASALVYYNGPFNIFSRFREYIESIDNKYLSELFSCMFCLPTNIGIILSIISLIFASSTPFTPFTILFNGSYYLWPLIVLFDGLYTGGIVSIIDSIVERINNTNSKIIL